MDQMSPHTLNTAWTRPGAIPPLRSGAVHVWRVPLKTAAGAEDWSHLCGDERGRAAAFRFEGDRLRYVTARVALKRLLEIYTGVPWGRLRFSVGAAGKPSLVSDARLPDVRFNYSHSGEAVLLAFSLGVEVGVDVEQCRSEVDHMDLASRFFAAKEIASLCAAPPRERPARFFALWTRKEACLKAIGRGLGFELDRFSVAGEDRLRSVKLPLSPAEPERDIWHRELPPIEGYASAVAYVGDGMAQVCPFLLSQ